MLLIEQLTSSLYMHLCAVCLFTIYVFASLLTKHNLLPSLLFGDVSNIYLPAITKFRYQISTFATKLGVRNIAFLGSGILLVNYIGSILAAIYVPQVNINSHNVPINYLNFVLVSCMKTEPYASSGTVDRLSGNGY